MRQKLGQNSKKTTPTTDRQRFRVGCVFLCVLLADTEIIVDGVVFTLGAVGVGGPRAAVTVRVAGQTDRRVVGDVDELVGATLAHAETTHTLPVVLARVTVLHAFLRARPALLVARHTALCTADTELGHWVTGSMGNLGQLSRPGHQVIVSYSHVHGRHGTGSLGHRVNGSFGSSFTSGSPGHRFHTALCTADMELGHWVTGSMGHLGQLSRPGHQVIIFTQPCARQTWNWVTGSPGQWVIWVSFHVRVTGSSFHTAMCTADMELGHQVNGSFGSSFKSGSPGHRFHTAMCIADMELGHWVTGSMGHLGHLSRPGLRVIVFIQPCARKQQDSHRPQTSPADQPRCGCGRAERSTFICDICL